MHICRAGLLTAVTKLQKIVCVILTTNEQWIQLCTSAMLAFLYSLSWLAILKISGAVFPRGVSKWKKKTFYVPSSSNYSKELKIYSTRNSANFFSYASNGEYFEELFTLILNWIVFNGWHMFSASAVQHIKLSNWLQCIRNVKHRETKKSESSDEFFRSGT